MLRQASSTPLDTICNFNRPHQSLSLFQALPKSSLGTSLGLGGAKRTSQLDSPLYLQGQLWGPHHLSHGSWGWGTQPAHQLVVRQAGLRLRHKRSFATVHPLAPSDLTCRLRLLPMPTGQLVAATLQAMELKWVASLQSRWWLPL